MTTRILIVDDSPTLRKGLTALLEQDGCSVWTAADGDEALAMVKKWSFDLIFLDCLMPRMNGLEVARSIREIQSSNTSVRIVGLRSELLGMTAEECLNAGMDDSIEKVNDPDAYKVAMKRWLSID